MLILRGSIPRPSAMNLKAIIQKIVSSFTGDAKTIENRHLAGAAVQAATNAELATLYPAA